VEASGSRVATAAGRSLPGIHIAFVLLLLLLLSLAFFRLPVWCANCAAALENVSVMQQAIQHGGDGGAVAQQFSPVFHGSVGRQQCAARS